MLEDALLQLTDLMSACRDPWAIFGGTAMVLHGYCDLRPADIDVLVSPDDAERIAAAHDLKNEADGGTERFRSRVVLHPQTGPMPIEIMAGFEIFSEGRWHQVSILDRSQVTFRSATASIASLDDIATIFRLSGRPKDLQRLDLLAERAGQ